MRKIVHNLRKIYIIKVITDVVFMFVYEFLANDIVSHLPIHRLRLMFYRHILRVSIGSNVYILKGLYIYPDLGEIVIGKNTTINNDVILDRRAGLYIGNNVNISREAAFYTGGHDIDAADFAYYGKAVVIHDYVWIGTRAMIMPGVTVGEGAVILPGAVVTHDCEAYTVYGGIPAQKIRKRNGQLDYELTWRSYFM